MKLSKLKELLENGDITQEEFDAMKETAEDDTQDDGKPEEDNKEDDLDKKIQAAIDRATNKLGNENKSLRKELDRLKKEKMTDEERAEAERKEREDELTRREREIKEKENRLYAIKAIKDAKLDDGSNNALELVEFVMADEEEDIDKRVKAFSHLVNKFVKAEVDKTFKKNGGTPPTGVGGQGGSKDNPYKKETFNLSKQMELELNNPEEAKKLKAEAGL